MRCKLKSLKIRRSLVAFHDNGQLVLVPHLMCGSALPLRFPLSALVVQATRQYLKFSSPFKWILDIHLCFVICLASFRVIVYSFDHCVVTKVTFSLIQIKGFTSFHSSLIMADSFLPNSLFHCLGQRHTMRSVFLYRLRPGNK